MEYELKNDGFYHTVTVTNMSKENMPLFLGFHTTFNTRFTGNIRPEDICAFVDISKEYERNMEINYLPTGVKPPFDAVSASLVKSTYKPFEQKASRLFKRRSRL